MDLRPHEKSALDAFCARVRDMFGERVEELVLFGSRARGDARPDSDVDVAVVVDRLTGPEARSIAYAAGDILTEHDVIVSPFAVSAERMAELRSRERLIAAEIARDGVPL